MAVPAPVKPPISKELLEKVDIRVGTIRRVEDVAASKKLVRLLVNFGDHERSILAGLRRERAHSEELIGRQPLFVVNLETKIMAGERSEGMLLDIGYADDIVPVLAVPETRSRRRACRVGNRRSWNLVSLRLEPALHPREPRGRRPAQARPGRPGRVWQIVFPLRGPGRNGEAGAGR